MRQMLKNKLKEQKGFTLIELLAVIVILGILAAIAIPSITHIIEKSKADAIRSDAKIILNAAKLYEADGNEIGSSGVNKSALANYIEHVNTFTDFTVNKDATTKVFTISGTGTKGKVYITFSNDTLDSIDNETYHLTN